MVTWWEVHRAILTRAQPLPQPRKSPGSVFLCEPTKCRDRSRAAEVRCEGKEWQFQPWGHRAVHKEQTMHKLSSDSSPVLLPHVHNHDPPRSRGQAEIHQITDSFRLEKTSKTEFNLCLIPLCPSAYSSECHILAFLELLQGWGLHQHQDSSF